MIPTARIVVICVAKRCLIDGRDDSYEVAVAQGNQAQWCRIEKDLWDDIYPGSPIGVEDLR